MNKVETKMCKAVLNGTSMSQGNTTVTITRDGEGGFHSAMVRLHGNEIAHYYFSLTDDHWVIRLSDGGWLTMTTKTRLHALMECVVQDDRVSIFQRSKKWYYTLGATTYNWIGQSMFMANSPTKVRHGGQKRETA